MANIILPGDPDFDKPIIMGDPYANALTPKLAAQKRIEEADKNMSSGLTKYAASQLAYAPEGWAKNAQAAGETNMQTNPMWFSPLHTAQSWQTPSKRRETTQWLITHCELTSYDYSSIEIKDFAEDFVYTVEPVVDTITGGFIFENFESDSVLSGQGFSRFPPKFSIRECNEKNCFEFKATGFWKTVGASEEHPFYVLNGKIYRHKVKLEKNEEYRRSKGIPEGGDKPKIELPSKLIEKKEAKDVDIDDYLLAPIPVCGDVDIGADKAWLIGLCVADGTIAKGDAGSFYVRYTMDKDESHKQKLIEILSQFEGKVSSCSHGPGRGWRVNKSTKEFWELCYSFIQGKRTAKKFTKKVVDLDRESRLHLLGGYFDGDGCFVTNQKRLVATNYSKDMADQVYWLLLSVGIRATLTKNHLSKNHYKTDSEWIYHISVPSSDVPKLQPYMRSDKIPTDFVPKPTRELRFFYEEDGITYLAQPIEYIKQFKYNGPGYDLQIDPERSFVASGYVTSNCRFFYDSDPKVAAAIDFYCFTPNMQVLLADGKDKPISSIKPEELIRSHDGTVNKVVRVFVRDADETLLKIKIDGETLETTFGHELLTEREGKFLFVKAGEFKVGDCLLTPINYDNVFSSDVEGDFVKDNYICRKIKEIETFKYQGKLYDLEIENSHSYVVNGVAVHNSKFSMNGFDLECPNRAVRNYFKNKVCRRLKLNENFKMISSEYFMIGDVFVHKDIFCEKCGGVGVEPETGEVCNHKGGDISNLVILNPDWIEVQQSPFGGDPNILMIPDDQLKKIVFMRQPLNIYNSLPEQLRRLVLQNKPIPLSSRTVCHLRHNPVPYGTYGTSLIRRLFMTLAYKTKLMTANWIVAERLILPVRVVKIGTDQRPASSADIADMQTQLAAVANDPNVTIVTHHAMDYDFYGACNSFDTKALCKTGWKYYDEISTEDEVMIFDPVTNKMCYEKPIAYHEYDFDGEMIEITGDKIDVCVTPNHKMLAYKRDKKTYYDLEAKDVLARAGGSLHFRANASFEGEDIESVKIGECTIAVDDNFLKFVGYYLSEGYSIYDEDTYKYITSFSQSESANPEKCAEIDAFMPKLGIHYHRYSYPPKAIAWTILNKSFAKQMAEWFGHNSFDKKIPSFLKNLPPNKLKIMIQSIIDGDASTWHHKSGWYMQCATNSEQLANDLLEVLFKCGKSPVISRLRKGDQYVVNCNMDGYSKGTMPRVKKSHIKNTKYKGKVWCFTTSTGYFVTMRNGRIGIHGNSGKILQVTQEMEFVSKEILDGFMLNQSLLNGEMCLTDDHEVLTKTGYKPISQVTQDDFICEFDAQHKTFLFRQPQELIKYDDVESVYEVMSGEKVLFKCTGSHKILCVNKDFDSRSGEMKETDYWTPTAEELYNGHLKQTLTLSSRGEPLVITGLKKVPYGKTVYCFKTSTGFFVAKYDETDFISSNSGYSSAQVGVETLIRRIEAWRMSLAEWAEEEIFLPIAEMQGFIDEEMSKELGERTYLYPRIKWNDLALKDKTQWHQILLSLHDKQVLSTQTLMEELDLNYDQEVKRMRYEQTIMTPQGGMMPGGGGAGGGMGMGGMGGGGGMPGGDMGGGMPGGDASGMPGMGGGAGPGVGGAMTPGGDMGGGMGGVGGPTAAGFKVMKKGKKQDQPEQPPAQMMRLTRIEKEMAHILDDVLTVRGMNKNAARFQYPIPNPHGGKPYAIDWALPHIKLGLESDGTISHSSEEQISHDKERDYLLAQRGWTILRFKDKEIEDAPQSIKQTIDQYIVQLSKKKTASVEEQEDVEVGVGLGDISDVFYQRFNSGTQT